MSEQFVWPSDRARAENDELNRVCEYAEQLHDALEEIRKGEPVGEVAYMIHKNWETGETNGVVLVDPNLEPGTPVFTKPGAAMAAKWRDTDSHVSGLDRARKIAELSRHNPIIRQALTMAQHHNRPRLECMEVAVLGLAESNQHLQKVATDAVIHGRSAFIVDPSGIQAVDAERLNSDAVFRSMEERIAKLTDLVRRIHDKLEYGDVYQWDDGSQVWRDMEAEVDGDPGQERGDKPAESIREAAIKAGFGHCLKPEKKPDGTTKLYVNLSRIAQKKLDQMGATAQGVLVRNEAGAWAAVSDTGRVMWLDDFEGQAV